MSFVLITSALAVLCAWLYLWLPAYLVRRAKWSQRAFVLGCASPACERYARSYDAWAAQHRFAFVGTYTVSGVAGCAIGVYAHESHPVFFEIEMAGARAAWRFRSHFQRDALLTTRNDLDPVPALRGERRQVFPTASLDELWEQHKLAHTQLVRAKRAVHVEVLPDYGEATRKGFAREQEELRKQPVFWPSLPLAWLAARKSCDQPAV